MIRKGWQPPPPSDVVAHAILDDMSRMKEDFGGVSYTTGQSIRRSLELTNAEREILRLLADGLTIGEVAECRDRSRETIKTQLDNARGRLMARNVTHAVALAIRNGML